ncbi:MAG: DUF1015 domain-containing protein [Nitrospinae bacterium]|nr:DUF1015 domain-containing protein [Nitrospinota bacterium]
MTRVNPFRGVRYNLEKIKAADVLAPPYDVISPDAQRAFYEKSDRNVVRLILGIENETDTQTNNRYTRSSMFLAKWLADGTLARDPKPALYLYAQDYEVEGEKTRRTGFICRRLIEPLGVSIFPHERTLSGPKTDRLNLTRACQMNFSPVFGLYSDPARTLDGIWAGIISNETPDIDVTDDEGVRHAMWTVADVKIIHKAQEFLEDKPVVIADGHHRYETALNYRNERRAAENPSGVTEYDCALMYLSNSCGEGFTVLPTHRVVKEVKIADMQSLLGKMRKYFAIEEAPLSKDKLAEFTHALALAGKGAPAFGMIAPGGKIYTLKLDLDKYMKETSSSGVASILRTLDVSVLQELVFENILGISKEAVADKKTVGYTIHAAEAAGLVESGAAKLAFLLNPADVDMVIKVATSGSVMPQKSTYFYPKLISGLVMNPLR